MNASEYRQQVAAFRQRLTRFATGQVPQGDRILIDTTGNRSRAAPSTSDLHRLTLYGRRRYLSIARVMVLFEILRDTENLATRPGVVRVEATGAYWQAFRGTEEEPACHTCPALLMLDGNLPTLMTSSIGLRRHLIVVFADCMLMPRLVNEVDRFFDDSLGWPAFEHAASQVLNQGNSNWRTGVDVYTEEMRAIFGVMISILEGEYRFSDDETQERFQACQAYYEGLFLTRIDLKEIGNFIAEVRSEMRLP